MISYRFSLATSLEKIFPNKTPPVMEAPLSLNAFLLETCSFQIAYRVDCEGVDLLEDKLQFEVTAGQDVEVVIRKVMLVPGAFPCNGEHDGDYLTTDPGLFPDLLTPVEAGGIRAVYHQWRALWVDLIPQSSASPGRREVRVSATRNNEEIWSTRAELLVLPQHLPQQKLIHTEMFHADCLADYYRVPVFSPEHWRIVENFIKTAAARGINMIFTPLFTPPMDTAEGGERTTVQLIDVHLQNDGYTFGFSRLEQWLEICDRHHIQYIEMAPLFTQWGAKSAPKIIATRDGRTQKIFGWETDAQGEEYKAFLRSFLPQLQEFLKSKNVLSRTWFHVSDEPHHCHLESYTSARDVMRECLPEARLFDALSDFSFYQTGAVTHPVVSNDHLEPFLQAGVPNLWTYYCCVQGVDVSNRFFALPSYRNRILGVQLYLYQMQGFLHWGYNFYNARFSAYPINPYAVTDCGEEFPSGDPFLVYPAPDGTAYESIRLMVLGQALADLRALELLEERKGREFVVDLVNRLAGQTITFKQYPRTQAFLLNLRNAIAQALYPQM